MDERKEFQVLGRKIGTGTGWDELSFESIIIYDFIPSEGVDLPSGCDLGVLYIEGILELYDNGNVVATKDIIDILKDIIRVKLINEPTL